MIMQAFWFIWSANHMIANKHFFFLFLNLLGDSCKPSEFEIATKYKKLLQSYKICQVPEGKRV